MDELLRLSWKWCEINLKCMALLDRANTPKLMEILFRRSVSDRGENTVYRYQQYDLYDQNSSEQTKDKGINIYTHGEMLPAHAYPELKSILT